LSEAVNLKRLFGHESVLKFISQSLILNRLSGTYIFSGPPGIGKSICAQHSAKLILCQDLKDGDACELCSSCLSFNDLESHTTFLTPVFKSKKSGVSDVDCVRKFINDVEKHSGFHRIVYLIINLEQYSYQVQNALLKTFEEPPENACFILCSDNPNKLLETIKSRAQTVYMTPLNSNEMNSVLKHLKIENEIIPYLIEMSDGSVETALKLNNPTYQLIVQWTDVFLKSQPSEFLDKADEILTICENFENDDLKKDDLRLRCVDFFKIFEKIFFPKLLKKSREHFVAWQATNTLIDELIDARYSIERSGHIALSVEHYMQKSLTRLDQINRFLKMKEIEVIETL